jgi:peroxiredoxin
MVRKVLSCLGSLAVAAAVFAALPTVDPEDAVSRPGPIDRGSDSDAERLVGRTAPELPARLRWLDGRTRTRASLAGRVVVLRSFTSGCPLCAATMPALERLHERYAERGVTVLGVYHPKPPRPTRSEDVAAFARSLGVSFPVAVDEDWSLVRRFWGAFGGRRFTSVTWILDRDGTIRYVHPGGEYHDGGGPAHERCRTDLRDIEQVLETLVAEAS